MQEKIKLVNLSPAEMAQITGETGRTTIITDENGDIYHNKWRGDGWQLLGAGAIPYKLVRVTSPTTIDLNDAEYLKNGDWAFSFESTGIVLVNFPDGWSTPTATGTGSLFLSVRTHCQNKACHQNLRMSNSWTTWTRYVNSTHTTFSVWRTGGAVADIDNYVATLTTSTSTALEA